MNFDSASPRTLHRSGMEYYDSWRGWGPFKLNPGAEKYEFPHFLVVKILTLFFDFLHCSDDSYDLIRLDSTWSDSTTWKYRISD